MHGGFKDSREGRCSNSSLLIMSFLTSRSQIYLRSTKGVHCIHEPVNFDTDPRYETRVVGGGLIPQGWYCPWPQLHRKFWVQEYADLIKHLLEGGETDKWNKIATRWMGVSKETMLVVHHLYTMEMTGTDHQKWERTRMEGMCAK